MMKSAILGLALGFAISGVSHADEYPMVYRPMGTDQEPVYVQIVVTACPAVEVRERKQHLASVTGTDLKPRYPTKAPSEEKTLTRQERQAYYKEIGCVEEPIPMEWVKTDNLTMGQCIGHIGYLISMQFLQQRQDLKGKQYVGQWVCIPSTEPFESVVSQ